MAGWQADSVVGDAAEGGTITLSWPSLKLSVKLRVAEVVPEERVVLDVGSSRLTLDIEPEAVLLTHEGIRSKDEYFGMQSAWSAALSLLGHGLQVHPHRERKVRWFMRPARTAPAFGHVFFTESRALMQWLTTTGGLGAVGSDVSLGLRWGGSITGTVLSNLVDRDVALNWTEDGDSHLVFRTFPSPRDPEERLIAICWSRWTPSPFPETEVRGFDAALDRLVQILDRHGDA